MCGIAGIWNKNQTVEKNELEKMVAILGHRGPDGNGYYIKDGVGLGHARLSIIDLETGQQPIHNEQKSIWVVFNGEIFNYIELREKLKKLGHIFYTKSDTEVLVHLYEQYGSAFVKYLNGQFAIALWDDQNKKLILARDRVGIAPLFYKYEKGVLLFASEIKAINFVAKEKPRPNLAALDQIFTFWAPVSPNTMFADVYEVSPGELIEFSSSGSTKIRYWDFSFPDMNGYREGDEEVLKEELREILIDSTRIRLRADVPVGAYLSGGLDSSVLVSLIHNYTETPLRTFSIGFMDDSLDESPYQKEMIDYINAEHSSIYCKKADISENIEDVIWHTESPIVRTAPTPMKLLSGLVHEQGYKVVLTGEGSDEVLGGYDIFKEAKIRQFWARQPESVYRALLLKKLYPYLDLSRGQSYLQNFFGAGLENPELVYFSHLPRWTTTAKIKEFYSDDVKSQLNSNSYDVVMKSLPAEMKGWQPFNRSQYIESKILMAGYLLSSQGDRMLMSNSVEGRFPFLDHRLIEFANNLNPKLKMKALNEKYLLKQSMKDKLPRNIVNRYKQPYRAPDIPAFINEGKFSECVMDYLGQESLLDYGYFNPEKVSFLLKKAKAGRAIGFKDNMAFVAMLTTQIWHRRFIESKI